MNNPLLMAPQATRSTRESIFSPPPEYEKHSPPLTITATVIDTLTSVYKYKSLTLGYNMMRLQLN